ncbi:hypothetical protein ACFOTA_07595 [Chitinophaga sp. GCM10012297]|uniref:Uncharacterized protein n=1 Tax=Chitinophaga chungangae TaxID=2821488 RepID=A0ABS3YC74_9BACT|nr:hypothetical protein [Chitinophaga chungangae]MBO9152065.1 hypothetical protein [Chitinophaga chungangae]
MVPLEEISLGGLFYRDTKVMQIREEHFGDLLPLLPRLEPIPIDPQRLWKLGFSRYVNTGVSYKDWQGVRLYLRPAAQGRWLVQFDGIPNAGAVRYIHEVQRLWFGLFREHLFQPRQLKQRHAMPEWEAGRKLVKDYSFSYYRKYDVAVKPVRDQPYYFTWDCRILFKSGQVAAWRVDEKSPLFHYAGRPWGLTLFSGSASDEDRLQAGKWLKRYLEEKG